MDYGFVPVYDGRQADDTPVVVIQGNLHEHRGEEGHQPRGGGVCEGAEKEPTRRIAA